MNYLGMMFFIVVSGAVFFVFVLPIVAILLSAFFGVV